MDTQQLSLYHFESCPFCRKVRMAILDMKLKIELRDIMNEPDYRDELVKQGGSPTVPCLRIQLENGSIQWLYESEDIIQFLKENFGG